MLEIEEFVELIIKSPIPSNPLIKTLLKHCDFKKLNTVFQEKVKEENVVDHETTSRYSTEELQKAYAAIAEAQYKRQTKKRRKKTATVVVSAIAFLPSLLVTYKLWKRAKRKELIQKRSGKKLRIVLENRDREDKNGLFNKDSGFRKVVLYKQNFGENELLYPKKGKASQAVCAYMTRAQAKRFDCSSAFFSSSKATKQSNERRKSKYKSKMIFLKKEREGCTRYKKSCIKTGFLVRRKSKYIHGC